jgi:predicted permease
MTIWYDLRDAARQVRRSPGFTAAALLSLALGIGANTAIFTLLDQVLLRPLPIANPEQVVLLTWTGPKPGARMFGDTMSYPAYRDIRDRNTVFDGVLGRYPLVLSVGAGSGSHTALVSGELVTGNYFEVLGIQPALGRLFTSDDDRVPGGHPLAVLSYDYWTAQFNADPAVIGRPLIVDGVTLTIIGVSPRGFDGVEVGAAPKIRLPMAMKAQMTQGWFSEVLTLENRRVYWVQTFARLKPGITMTQAEASLQPLARAIVESEVSAPEIAQVSPEGKARFLKSSLRVQPNGEGRSGLRETYDLPLRVLMAMVGFVVLIACANVANLLIERAMGRQREIAVRQALGASAWQIVRRMLTESLMLSLLGGAAGLLLAMWTSQALIAFVPTDDDPLNLRTTPDLRILLFTLALCLTTGLLFGLAPALASRRVELTESLRPNARGVAGGHGRLRQLLVIAQVSLSVLLLIGASQFLRTLVNLRHVDLGLRTAQITTFAVNPSLNGYGKARSRQFYRELMDRIRATPGVESAGAAAIGALEGDGWTSDVTIEGGVMTGGTRRGATMNLVSAGYRATLGIPLLAGRDFSPNDATMKHLVAVVNETFAREYFGSQNPIGKRLGMGSGPGTTLNIEIVGLMKDSRFGSVRAPQIPPRIFLDNDQNDDVQQINAIVGSTLDADQMHAAMRRLVQSLDPNVPVFNARTLDAQADRTLARERMVASLASAFGLLATLVAAVGVYALMAFSVTGRTREIGVRLALGARTAHVTWLVMREVLTLIVIGTAIALPAAWALSRAVQSQLYGVTPQDAASMFIASGVLAMVASLAGFIPARRATRINPTEALRAE